MVRKAVPEKEIKALPEGSKWFRMPRDKFVSMDFEHEKQGNGKRIPPTGEYKIIRLGVKNNVNKYVCKRIDGVKVDETEYKFDMGYVQKIILSDIHPFKE